MAGPLRPSGDKRYAKRRSAALRFLPSRSATTAVLISRPEDVSYLTGFDGADSFVLLGRRWASLITDGRYAEQAARQCPGLDVHVRTGSVPAAVAEVLGGRGIRSVVVQSDHITVAQRSRIDRGLPAKRIRAVADVISKLRQCKDTGEIAAIRKAIRIAQRAFGQMLAGGVNAWVGKSERQLAAELDHRMRLAGADRPAFETIVAAGAHASQPHYRPQRRKLKLGDPVLVDWGAVVGGYCSDLTRVVFAGRIPPKIAKVYKVVRRAQSVGMAAIRPGVSCKSVDLAARRVITEAGYGDQFTHSLGHGIGRQVHELPLLGRAAKSNLRSGMVVTVEPGIYLPGVGGVRIEDDVLVTRDGHRRLSSLPRSASAMVLE